MALSDSRCEAQRVASSERIECFQQAPVFLIEID